MADVERKIVGRMKGTIDVAQRQRRGAVRLDSAVSVRKSRGVRVLAHTLCYNEIARLLHQKKQEYRITPHEG